ncbi:hypothetical protein D3C81_1961420 [compost metagenome]
MLLHILNREISLGRLIYDITSGAEKDGMGLGVIFNIVNPDPVDAFPFKQGIR